MNPTVWRLVLGKSRLEDYLEAIYHLIQDKGYASTVEIAENLRVTPPTVSSMLQRLAAKGYLVHERYRGILTEKFGEEYLSYKRRTQKWL
jgi:Mn-dependent DtxR family transcriptional regulator